MINNIHKEIVLQESLVNGALYGHGEHFQYSSQIYQVIVGTKLYKFQQYSTVI
jgi:hypothetical protein